MPEAGEDLNISASAAGEEMSLRLEGLPSASGYHFFPLNEMIWHDVVQSFEISGNALSVSLPIDSYWEENRDLLTGLLAFTDETGAYRGVLISEPIEAVPPGAAYTLGSFMAIGFAFLGGLILNLMPCVLPVLSLKALSLVKTAGRRRCRCSARGRACLYSWRSRHFCGRWGCTDCGSGGDRFCWL